MVTLQTRMKEPPEEISTDSPKEVIKFCIAHGIKEGILPEKFNMNQDGHIILEDVLEHNWNILNMLDGGLSRMAICFIAGYAVCKGQIGVK